MQFGLQAYTIRNEVDTNLVAAFNEVKKVGYRYIELPGLFNRGADDLRSFLCNIDLSVASVMFSIEELVGNIDQVALTCKKLQSRYAVCAYLNEDRRTRKGYLEVAKQLDLAAEKLEFHGITLAYHNHGFEFKQLESGICGYDILVSQTTFLTFELDVFWVMYAGLAPMLKMEELGKKLSLLHLKDMDNECDKNFCELGTGVIDLASIIQVAEKKDIPFAFVEQDDNWISGNAMESIKKSFDWLKEISMNSFRRKSESVCR